MARHVKQENDHKYLDDLSKRAKRAAEDSYRRGVQQAFMFASWELERRGRKAEASVLYDMMVLAGEMRYSSQEYPCYLDALAQKFSGPRGKSWKTTGTT